MITKRGKGDKLHEKRFKMIRAIIIAAVLSVMVMPAFAWAEEGEDAGAGSQSSYVARVSNDDGRTWTCFSEMITSGDNAGALSYANSLSGSVIIETLKETDPAYTLSEAVTINGSKSSVTIRTISGTDPAFEELTGQTEAFRSVLSKSHNARMLTTDFEGTVILKDLILDGNRGSGVTGGLVLALNRSSDLSMQNVRLQNAYVTTESGVGVHSYANTMTLTDCDFYDCDIYSPNGSTKINGGGIYCNRGTLTMYGCVFDLCDAGSAGDNDSTGRGGAVFADGGTTAVTIDKSSYSDRRSAFTTCTARRYGGAILLGAGSNCFLTMKHTDFNGCKASSHYGGGSVSYNGDADSFLIEDCAFTQCSAGSDYGGGASLSGGGTMINTSFTSCVSNSGSGGAGGLHCMKDLTFKNTGNGEIGFYSCTSKRDGGGIRVGGTMNLINAGDGDIVFDHCTANYGGGYHSTGVSNVTNAGSGNIIFKDCSVSTNGGGLSATGGLNLINAGSGNIVFNKCSSSYAGGGIEVGNGSVNNATIDNQSTGQIMFQSCTASRDGGGISVESESSHALLLIKNRNSEGTILFDKCEGNYGGAACIDSGGSTTIQNTGAFSCNECKANYGGNAIWTGVLTMRDNSGSMNFSGCAERSGSGRSDNKGAILANRGEPSNDTFVLTCTETGTATFVNCSADQGGAIHVSGGKATITSENPEDPITIIGCATTNGNGGAINHAAGDSMQMKNVAISSCTATGLGGGVYCGGPSTITDCSVTGCSSSNTNGGAVYGTSMFFEGNTVIYGNPSRNTQQKNVILPQDSSTVINTTAAGLGANAEIGVYAVYDDQGLAGRIFGTYNSAANLDRFINDRDTTLKGGVSQETGKISWGTAYYLTYDRNGAIQGTAPTDPNSPYEPDAPVTVLGNENLFKTNYDFDGWNTEADGSGTPYAPEDTFNINEDTVLYAQWKPAAVTVRLVPDVGMPGPSSYTESYGTTITGLPTLAKAGHVFGGWYADFNGTNLLNLGRDYMYTDKISIHLTAYSENWGAVGSQGQRLISCTEYGGWNIEMVQGHICFTVWDAGKGYKHSETNTRWTDLSPGWHDFDLVFDGEHVYGYLDGTLASTSPKFESGAIGYNATNSIFIGAEAHDSPTVPDSNPYFVGQIGNIIIEHSNELIPASAHYSITLPGEDLTLYPIWKANTYTIEYEGLEDAVAGGEYPESAAFDQTFTVSNPMSASCTFVGWRITGMDGVAHTYGDEVTIEDTINCTRATSFRNLRETAGTVTFTALWDDSLPAPTGYGKFPWTLLMVVLLVAMGTGMAYRRIRRGGIS